MEPLTGDDPRRIGRYDVLGRLGAGGMGRVYLARSASGRQLAIKVIHRDLVASPEFRARFAREIAAVRAVGGFYTAAVVDADPDAELPWLATEYVPGPSLDQAVRENGPLTGEPLRRLAVGLAEALTAIHAAGLVHRDFKPSNVLLAADGPRVIDFGIARAFDATALTSAQHVVGTAGFMAPEQLRDGTVTAAADVFCLGLTLVYAATGRPPFGTGGMIEVSYRVVSTEPDLTGVPTALAAVVERCLIKDPERRPDIRQVLDALTGGGAGPVAAPVNGPVTMPVGGPATATASATADEHRRSVVPLAVSSAAVLAIAAGVGTWYLSSGKGSTSNGNGSPILQSSTAYVLPTPRPQTSATSSVADSVTSSATSAVTESSSTVAQTVVVGSLNFPESEVLSEIYAQALTAKGVNVTRKFNLGSREVTYNALKSGTVSVLPEYNGALLSFLEPGAAARTTADVDVELAAKLDSSLEILNPSPAQDNDVLVVTAATAAQYRLTSVADLAAVADKLTLGAAPEFQTRQQGLLGLQSAYKLHFKSFKALDAGGPLTLSALRNGDAQVVDLFGTEPSIVTDHLVALTDEKVVFGSQNVIPLVSKSVLPQVGADALNSVSAKLTTTDLARLNEQVLDEKKAPADVAHDWLVKAGLA